MERLFIISQEKYGDCQVYQDESGFISGIYIDLETAKNALKNIYKETSENDYIFYEYKITVYQLNGSEFKMTNRYYTYVYDIFLEFN